MDTISSKYTFDDSFRAQYNASPSQAVEYSFDSLKAMMESVVLKHSAAEGTTVSFGSASASYTVEQTAGIKQKHMQLISGQEYVVPYLSNPLARSPSPEWESSIWAEQIRKYEESMR